MPKLGHFIELFEALSRRDWDEINHVANSVVEYEREQKHFDAANKLRLAIETAISNDGLSDSFVEAKHNAQVPPIDLLEKVEVQNVEMPILTSSVSQEIDSFLKEWSIKSELERKGITPRNRLLFYGPPGCGKTMLAKYLAKSLGMNLFLVRFDSLVSSFLGETGANLRKVFKFIESNRCILFIDEIDAIAKLRDDHTELGELKRVVISLLQNVDSISSNSILIAATNHAHLLDSALWRRFEIALKLDLPDEKSRVKFVEKYLDSKITGDDLIFISEVCNGLSGSDLEQISKDTKRKVILNKELEEVEALYLTVIDYLRRVNSISNETIKDDRILMAVKALKKKYKKKYSYNELEVMSGIPHSTLHHKFKNESVQ